MIRLDKGSENVRITAVQFAFRESHSDYLSGEKSFRFGTSPANIVSIITVTVTFSVSVYRELNRGGHSFAAIRQLFGGSMF